MSKNRYTVAVDLGSTTISLIIYDMDLCIFKDTVSFANPQRKYGFDIVTRIDKCIKDKQILLEMGEMVRESILDHAKTLIKDYSDDYSIEDIIISGNTTMQHILRGDDVSGLAAFPFSPVSLDYMQKEINGTKYIFLPGFSAFVGADIMSGAISLEMDKKDKPSLLIDLGTNGEMLLVGEESLSTSCACGPVFDYAAKGAEYGSILIKALSNSFKRGLINSEGLIAEPFFEKGIMIDEDFVINQESVRRFQMAKAAVYAGIKCLLDKAGLNYFDIENTYITGGLGFHVNVRDMARLKMFPDELLDSIKVIENTSLSGAKLFAGIDNDELLTRCNQLRTRVSSFELAEFSKFNDIYVESMNF